MKYPSFSRFRAYQLAFVLALGLIFASGTLGKTASTNVFSPPVQLHTSFNPIVASAAIDDGGNAIVVRSGSRMLFSIHPAGGAWSAPMVLSQRTVPGGSPVFRMTSGGNATVVSFQSGTGIFAADKPLRESFGTAIRVVNAPKSRECRA